MATQTDLRGEILADLDRWGLLFCAYATYRDLFGNPVGGMVPLEVTEVHLAWDEWNRYTKARKVWDEEHEGIDQENGFDQSAYIRDRLYCIEHNLDAVPLDPL